MRNNIKIYKIAIVFSLMLGVVIGHGFPTLYQYIETLGGDYVSSPQRGEILNSDIQTGEPMKASTMNAKFNALNAELNDLEGRIVTVEGMSSVTSGSSSRRGCTDNGCFFTLTGVAHGQSTARSYLVYSTNGSVSIAKRSAITNTNFYTNQFDAPYLGGDLTSSIYATDAALVEAYRVKASEIDLSKFTCTGNGCFFALTGVAHGQSTAKSYLVYSTNGSVSIAKRTAITNTNFYTTQFDAPYLGGDLTSGIYATDAAVVEAYRVKASEVDLLGE